MFMHHVIIIIIFSSYLIKRIGDILSDTTVGTYAVRILLEWAIGVLIRPWLIRELKAKFIQKGKLSLYLIKPNSLRVTYVKRTS